MANRVSPKSVSKLSYDNPRFKLTPEKAVLLIKWFDEHKDHPYPTRHEKILLCQQTQLTFTQVISQIHPYTFTLASHSFMYSTSFTLYRSYITTVDSNSLWYILCNYLDFKLQVSTWFANARRRMKKASLEDEELKSSSTGCSSPECSASESPASDTDNVIIESEATFANGDNQGELGAENTSM